MEKQNKPLSEKELESGEFCEVFNKSDVKQAVKEAYEEMEKYHDRSMSDCACRYNLTRIFKDKFGFGGE